MITDVTFLAPGQRYIKADLATWRSDYQITIVKIEPGADERLYVTYHCPSGRYVRGQAAEFEIAVAVGDVVPVVGSGQTQRC